MSTAKVMMHNDWEGLDVELLFSNLDELHEDLYVSDITESEMSSNVDSLEINTRNKLNKRKWDDYSSSSDTESVEDDISMDGGHRGQYNDHQEDYFLQYSLMEMKKVIFTPRACMKKVKKSPEQYTQQFIDGLNAGCIDELKDAMNKFCAPNVKISKKFYPNLNELHELETAQAASQSSASNSKRSSSKSAKKDNKDSNKEEDFIQTIDFHSLHEFFYYMQCYHNMIPDGITQVQDHRCCYENENNMIFITSFTFQGTLLASSAVMSVPEKKWSNTLPFNYLEAAKSRRNVGNCQRVKMEGSLVCYVNDQGLVDCIEFYETRC